MTGKSYQHRLIAVTNSLNNHRNSVKGIQAKATMTVIAKIVTVMIDGVSTTYKGQMPTNNSQYHASLLVTSFKGIQGYVTIPSSFLSY